MLMAVNTHTQMYDSGRFVGLVLAVGAVLYFLSRASKARTAAKQEEDRVAEEEWYARRRQPETPASDDPQRPVNH